jgi:hypothetical protein
MLLKKTIAAAALLLVGMAANADLEPWADYEASDEVYMVSAIKVDSNMGDAYLEGLRETWIKGNEVAKELGQIKDYAIYRSQLPDSGDFNLLLVITLESAEFLQPSKERYDAFMEEVGKQAADEMTDFAQENYPAMREITGSYMMRKIDIK